MRLERGQAYENAGDKLVFTGTTSFKGLPRVSGFRLHSAQYREMGLELTKGDVVIVGQQKLTLTNNNVTFDMEPRPQPTPGRLSLGETQALTGGRSVALLAITQRGVELFFTEKNGIANSQSCSFGFLRIDGILLLITKEDRQAGTVVIEVKADTPRIIPVQPPASVTLGIEDAASFDDGEVLLMLRFAQRRRYGGEHWRFITQSGDNRLSYPEYSEGSGADPAKFHTLRRKYSFKVIAMSEGPPLQATLLYTAEMLKGWAIGQTLTLKAMDRLVSRDGITLRYLSTLATYGKTSTGSALFEVSTATESQSFSVRIDPLDTKREHAVLGLFIRVLEVRDGSAKVRVERASNKVSPAGKDSVTR